jgi:hypothetical protein
MSSEACENSGGPANKPPPTTHFLVGHLLDASLLFLAIRRAFWAVLVALGVRYAAEILVVQLLRFG